MKAEELKEIRKLMGFTQAQLAEEIGVSMQALQLWEYGKRKISASNEKLILAVFDKQKNKQVNLVDKFGSLDSVVKNMIEARYTVLANTIQALEEKIGKLEAAIDHKLSSLVGEKSEEAVNLIVKAEIDKELKEVNETLLTLFRKGIKQDKRLDIIEGQHLKKSN